MGERLEASGLLRTLKPEEVEVLSTIYEPFRDQGRFPILDYVDRVLFERGLDATSLLVGLPTASVPTLYGLIRPGGPRFWRAEEAVELTVAGLVQCPKGEEEVAVFLSALQFLIEREGRGRPDPYEVRRLQVPSDHIRQHLQAAGFDLLDWTLPKLRVLLQYEPAGAASGTSGKPEDWSVQVSKDIRLYRGVTDAETYLERVLEYLAPPQAPLERMYTSPFTLAEAIDFLDAIWQVRFGKGRLVRLGSAGAVTSLALGCATEDEFKSRVSALADVLARFDVPSTDGLPAEAGSLVRLEAFLEASLASPDADRLADSIAALKAMIGIRAGGQHTDARTRQVEGYARLGIPYPITNWAIAWEHIQSQAVEAVNAVREEIQRDTST